MPQFEVFKKRMIPLAKVPYVTIQKRGTMSFNIAAHAALGAPDAIELLYDPAARIIGVRAIDPSAEHAYPIRASGGKTQKSGRSFLVSGQAFTKYYDIGTDVSRRWPAVMEDGVLCIDLNQEGTVVTSNRQGRTKAAASNGSGVAQPSEASIASEIESETSDQLGQGAAIFKGQEVPQ